jgi:aspartyl aminopeptidase
VIGTQGVKEGFNICASHIDAPRLDIKPNPLNEDSDSQSAYLKTHYYGGIKKYHWVQIPWP